MLRIEVESLVAGIDGMTVLMTVESAIIAKWVSTFVLNPVTPPAAFFHFITA